MKREGDKYVELSQANKNFQFHGLVSIIYSFIVIALFVTNAVIHGIQLDTPGTEIERNIVLLGGIWFTFDTIQKYFDGVNDSFVWVHHTMTVLAMTVLYYSENTHTFGATALFINDLLQAFWISNKILEQINYPRSSYLYQSVFWSLGILYILSRVFGNHWMIYKGAMTAKLPLLAIVGTSPICAFGTIFSIKLSSKMWKNVPLLSSHPEKVESKIWWLTVRKQFQRYQNEKDFQKMINSIIYLSAIILPTFIALHARFDFSHYN
mmetsp:Transcript_90/g.88  ORF Transcript_90/g.88 Transcript_90/m.88 type:complete len:265 (+) Transcript_90:133-927(+)